MPSQSRFGGKDTTVLILAAVLGSALWTILPVLTGRAEAWDAPAYWGIIVIASFGLGLLAPSRAWRWGLALVAGQAGALLGQAMQGPGNLWPLALAMLVALAAFCALLSWLGGLARSVLARNRQPSAADIDRPGGIFSTDDTAEH